MKYSDNYHHMSKRIKSCKCLAELRRVDQANDRVYEAGCLELHEFRQLTSMIFDRIINHEQEG